MQKNKFLDRFSIMKEVTKALELTRPERHILGEVQKGSPRLYANIVQIVADTFVAISEATNSVEILQAIDTMLNTAEAEYNILAPMLSTPEIMINKTRAFICCLAYRLLPLAENFSPKSISAAA